MDPTAANYLSGANSPGSCVFAGCLDENSLNFDSYANVDHGLCTPTFRGCTESSAINYDLAAHLNDGSCQVGGCTLQGDANFNPLATFFDGSCSASAVRRRQLDGHDSGADDDNEDDHGDYGD